MKRCDFSLLKKTVCSNERRRSTRRAFLGSLLIGLVWGAGGCALLGKNSASKKAKEADDAEKNAFEVERDNQESLSDFVSKTGRSGKEKKDVSRGETFLMSDKAREIYANTER